ncbi:MAG TPA: alpha/beta hydrolase [Acidimicrobiales bacterium]|nr:alpha/beta hydrolase [Acidimicrobiales bacterium]
MGAGGGESRRAGRTARPVSIAYEVVGAHGPALVLVHGLGYGRWGWGRFAELLARRRRLVLVDNRGIGGSDAPPGPYSVAEMAADVAGVLDELGLERVDVLGASLGGMIALHLALDDPKRLRRVVLVAATPGEVLGTRLPASTARLLRRRMPSSRETQRRLVAGALSPATLAERPELVDALVELRERHPQQPAAWEAQAAASAAFCASGGLERVTNPVLALAGLDDAVIDPRNSELLAAALPNGRAELLTRTGHLCFFEHPDRLAALVEQFLDGHSPPGTRVASNGSAP